MLKKIINFCLTAGKICDCQNLY